MTITIEWWHMVIILFVIPIITAQVADTSHYGAGIEILLLMLGCWGLAIGITIGKLL